MDANVLLAFWAVAMLIIIAPGADWAYAITGGMSRRAAPAVLGMLTGHSLGVLIVAAGVGAMVASHPSALTVITLAGAAYLVYLGVGAIRRPGSLAQTDGDSGSSWRWWARGVGVSGMNPKVLLMFVAILPQFARTSADLAVPAQLLVLGAIHVISTAVVYFAVGFGASAVLSSRPAAARVVSRLSGVAMLLIGTGLLVEQLVA